MSHMHDPAHPGEVLREYLPGGMSITEAARRLGVTRQSLSAILNRRAGISAEMWLSMQTGYDLWQAEQMPRAKLEPIVA